MGQEQLLSTLTTLRVGGVAKRVQRESDPRPLVQTVKQADQEGVPLLLLGGGSNVVAADAPFPGLVLQDSRNRVLGVEERDGSVVVEVAAGTPWDQFVAETVERGWSGVEALSGIPGSVGAGPVQNIGAYGRELSDNLVSVLAFDRQSGKTLTLSRDDLELGYRDSLLKRSLFSKRPGQELWASTPRWLVLSVKLRLGRDPLSAPIRYTELASRLGVEVGDRAQASAVREAVLDLRRSKGMVLDPADHDTWSAGSFFTNPMLSSAGAELLPEGAPRFLTKQRTGEQKVKTSAAWLIDHAGFGRGWSLYPGAQASLSTKHVLAVTNRGHATTSDVVQLARAVRAGVAAKFGITLVAEPVFIGIEL